MAISPSAITVYGRGVVSRDATVVASSRICDCPKGHALAFDEAADMSSA
jgi:hypothetical protein